MANFQHLKATRTRVLNTLPVKSFGNDGDIVIPLDAFLKKSREAHSKVAEVFQSIMNDDPTFRKRNSTWVE